MNDRITRNLITVCKQIIIIKTIYLMQWLFSTDYYYLLLETI